MNKLYNINDLKKRKFKTFPFSGKFAESFGEPETNGCWLIWGLSANGKTRFALQLARYLAGFTKVYYNTLEEGVRLSFQKALLDNDMEGVGNAFQFTSENFELLAKRLEGKRPPRVAFIDSLQYLRLTVAQYIELRERFPKTLFIFISHAKNDQPKGSVAEAIMYDADVKVHVADFMANVQSRFGGNKPYTVWQEGYEQRTFSKQ